MSRLVGLSGRRTHRAREQARVPVAKLRGVRLDAVDKWGKTAVMIADDAQKTSALRILRDAGETVLPIKVTVGPAIQ